jgi:hypothetical protein
MTDKTRRRQDYGLTIGDRVGEFTLLDIGYGNVGRFACINNHVRTTHLSAVALGPCKKCRAKPKGVSTAFSSMRRNAKNRGYEVHLTHDQYHALVLAPCRYCGGPGGGVDRQDNSIGYTPENSVPCCSTCNYAKRDQSVQDFLAWVERVHQHQPSEGE